MSTVASGSSSVNFGSISRTTNEVLSPPLEGAATVTVQLGLTLNLGNYQTARVDVGVTLPCQPTQLDEAYAFAKGWVEQKLRQESQDTMAYAVQLRKQAAGL